MDWLIAAFLALGVLHGFRKGFLASALEMVASAAAIGLGIALASPLVALTDRIWHVVDRAASAIAAQMPLPPELAAQPLSQPGLTALLAWVHTLPWPAPLRDRVDRSVQEAAVQAMAGGGETIGAFADRLAATAALELLAFTVVYLIAAGALRFIAGSFARGSGGAAWLGGLNQMAGGALGLAANGLTAAVVLSAMLGLSALAPMGWSAAVRSSAWATALVGLLDHVTRAAVRLYAAG